MRAAGLKDGVMPAQAVNLNDVDSEVDVEDTKLAILQGPARLQAFKPVALTKPKKDADIVCDVCGDADEGER